MVVGGRSVGLVELTDIVGDVVEFTVYQGSPVKLYWSKLPPAVQLAFAEDKAKLLAPPHTKTLAKLNDWLLVNGLVMQKAPGGLLVEQGGFGGQIIFVRGCPSEAGYVDRDPIRVYAKEGGTFQYTTVTGAQSTVRAYQFTAEYKD